MEKFCSKKGCNNIGKYRCGNHCYYCIKHHRFCQMRSRAKQDKKFSPTWNECEILLFIWCSNFRCPVCNIKLKWRKDNNGQNNVISLQHNNDRTIMFICCRCNNGHGHSKLGDRYFDLKDNEKYCPLCNKILLKNKFNRSKNRKDGLDNKCRKCISLYRKKSKRKYTSKYRGVSWRKDRRKWRANIQINKKSIHLGYFHNEIDAAKAYDKATIKYFENFTSLNFN